jgi:hypothetical protein
MQNPTRKRKLSRSAVPPIRIPPRTAAPFIFPAASSDLTINSDDGPYSISGTQTRCGFTTQALVASEDAVYTAAFGSRSLRDDHNHHPVTVSLLSKSPPISLSLPDLGACLDGCSSVPFNFSSLSRFVSHVIKGMEVPVGLVYRRPR